MTFTGNLKFSEEIRIMYSLRFEDEGQELINVAGHVVEEVFKMMLQGNLGNDGQYVIELDGGSVVALYERIDDVRTVLLVTPAQYDELDAIANPDSDEGVA